MIDILIHRKAFGPNQILGGLALSIEAGQTVALHGPSGIGKSTLLNIVAGLDQDFEGEINKPDKLSMVFQEPTLLPWRTVLQNIRLIAGVDDRTATDSLNQLRLGGKEHLYPNQLSLGQQRRLSLARAFAQKPDFLIMDEPFTSLDQKLVDEMLSLTRDLIKHFNMTTLFVTHSPLEADFLADVTYELQGIPASLKRI